LNLSSPFIRRPVATTLMAVAFLLIGIVGYVSLPVAALPNVDFPTVQIGTSLPGASPETMASNVATPLERQFSLIPGIVQMTSVSSLGSTSITLQFELGQNMTTDFEQVQAAINAASAQLPANLPAQPTIRQVNPADAPIMILSLTSDSLPLDQVDNYADVILSQQVSRIDGVGLVTIGGQQKPAVRIQIDPRKVAARGLQIDNVRAQIVAATTNQPKGAIVGAQRGLTVYANDQILTAAPWNDLVVGYQNGSPIRVKDLGSASQSVENNQIGAWIYPGLANTDPTMKGGQGILLVIYKDARRQRHQDGGRDQKGAAGASGEHSAGHSNPRSDGSDADDQRVGLRCEGHAAHHRRSRGDGHLPVPAQCARDSYSERRDPVGPVGDHGDHAAAGIQSRQSFADGDDHRRRLRGRRRDRHGGSDLAARRKGRKTVRGGAGGSGRNQLHGSFDLDLAVAVFTPLMFMGGVVGLLMREFAITLSAAVMLSLVLTLTLTPMLCSRFLRVPAPPSNWFTKGLEKGFANLENGYARSLDIILRHKFTTLMVFLATIAFAVVLYATASTGFFPQQDTGFLSGVMITSQDASFTKTKRKIQDVAHVLGTDPAIAGFGMFVGSSSTNSANLFIALKPKDAGRKASADQVITGFARNLPNSSACRPSFRRRRTSMSAVVPGRRNINTRSRIPV
jgi:hydrophobic/amphiphilic exporter-1 (mainly G- bacteria), HAE1 family